MSKANSSQVLELLASSSDWPSIGDKYKSSKPFRWAVIDHFFDEDIAQALIDEFPRHNSPQTLLNEFGEPNPKSTVSKVKEIGNAYKEVDSLISSIDFIRIIEEITGINGLEYDPYYFGAGTHENFHTAGLDPHFDFNLHPITKHHRRLNLIIYLNHNWNPEWGGHICLHTNPYDTINDEVIEIEPAFNRAILFETNEYSWHSVKPINHPSGIAFDASRKSFTIYYYSKERPVAEQAPSHGTVYVQPNLPAHIKEGHILTQEDISLIQSNVQRRNSYLQQLYKREYQFSEEIESLKRIVEDMKSKPVPYIPLAGSCIITSIVKACLSDHFVADRIEFDVKTLHPVQSALKLVGYVPKHLFRSTQTIHTKVYSVLSNELLGSAEHLAPSDLFEIRIPLSTPENVDLRVCITSTEQIASISPDNRLLSFKLSYIEII
jgi:hypothetical protein